MKKTNNITNIANRILAIDAATPDNCENPRTPAIRDTIKNVTAHPSNPIEPAKKVENINLTFA